MIAIDKSRIPWILLVVFIALFVAGCEKQDMADPSFRAEIESRVGVKFPPSATYIQCQLDRGMDYRLLCKFTAPKKDVAAMFSGLGISWSRTERAIENWQNPEKWFDPDSIKAFQSGGIEHPNKHSGLGILYEDPPSSSGETIVLVFLAWAERLQ